MTFTTLGYITEVSEKVVTVVCCFEDEDGDLWEPRDYLRDLWEGVVPLEYGEPAAVDTHYRQGLLCFRFRAPTEEEASWIEKRHDEGKSLFSDDLDDLDFEFDREFREDEVED